MLPALIAAEATGSGGGADWTGLAQYGVLGLVVLGFIFGKIVPGYLYERRVQEVEALKAEVGRLRDTIEEKVIPALIRSTDVLARYVDRLNVDEATAEKRKR